MWLDPSHHFNCVFQSKQALRPLSPQCQWLWDIRWMFLVNFSNNFNCADRSAMFEEIQARIPCLAPWMECCYGAQSALFMLWMLSSLAAAAYCRGIHYRSFRIFPCFASPVEDDQGWSPQSKYQYIVPWGWYPVCQFWWSGSNIGDHWTSWSFKRLLLEQIQVTSLYSEIKHL